MLLLKSIILGFSVSAPVGPIGLLCIQRTLTKGQMAGFFTGLGASTANMIYASFAAFGFSVVSSFLLEQQFILRIIGGVFLLYLGVKIFLAKPAERAASLEGNGLIRMYLSTLFLMITNPTTILNFVAMFAGLGFDKTASSPSTAFIFVSGVFLGAIFWWFLLSFSVSIFKNKITPYLKSVNKIAGMLIISLGCLAFLR
ncbi:LysE family transporter [Geobacillus sp. 44B]|nr:LysE family transporter [Geobacillus sp. 44B]